ncbi:MAG TPA: nucleotide disphospho-sugar-binding domain-containing protein [Pseudonocardiaceae bacterium]|jgi:MGT family glycosyltransferase|nr:nucleotide disphospho-sugar-binding domain-containing protein [Pseudonocardiaceae bacterium]
MTRYLFVSLPLAGHVNPASALASHLTDVAWAGSELALRPMLGPDATILPTGSRLFREQGGSGLASVRSLWTRFIVPYAKFVLPGVERAVRTYQPDVLVVDQHAVAGALVAQRHGLPWATVICSAMELTEPLRGLPKVAAWTLDHLRALWSYAGLPPDEFFDVRYSPYLTIAPTTSLLAGREFPDRVRLVGPLVADRPAPPFPFDRLDPHRTRVLVTMGTLADDLATNFYRRAIPAIGPAQGIVVADLPDAPADVIVAPRVPMLRLLPHVDAVVGHAGMNTTVEALANGVPLVLAPIRHDQPEMARQVVAAGAGVRVNFRRAGTAELADAVRTVLHDVSYRRAATRIAESFRDAGGAAEAAACLARLRQPTASGDRS